MRVYLDNAATTKVDSRVVAAMEAYFTRFFGNASEPHLWGQEARKAVDEAREKLAKFFAARPSEIIFTSCATESINFSHKGLIEEIRIQRYKDIKRPHIITSQIEHKAVIETCKHLEKLGLAKVTYLPVDKYGLVKVDDVRRSIRPETVLVSIMYVNNEVGTVEPIAEIGKLIKEINKFRIQNSEFRIYFHTDATQAIQYYDCRVEKLGVDLLSFSGHKLHAPKGVGALYIRKGTPIIRQQDGGGQEYRLRAGTENVPYIVALGKAVEIAKRQIGKTSKLQSLRDKLIKGVLKIPGTKLTGHPIERAPHVASFVVDGAEGEAMLLLLSEEGIAASSGSACTSGILEPSHVLTAMRVPAALAHGSLRFSLSKGTTEEEVAYVLKVLPRIVERLRKMNPLYKKR
jgi:cysteine desulfurase